MTEQQKPTREEVDAYAMKIAELAREVDEWWGDGAKPSSAVMAEAGEIMHRAVALFGEGVEHNMPLSLRACAKGFTYAIKDTTDAVGEVIDEEDNEPKPN